MLKKIGSHLEKKHLFLVGADWNMEPSLVDSTGLPRRLDAALFVPEQRACVSPSALTTVVFFMASTSMARAVEQM
eukprot:3261928-Pyramimonas_sp.AAC.1